MGPLDRVEICEWPVITSHIMFQQFFHSFCGGAGEPYMGGNAAALRSVVISSLNSGGQMGSPFLELIDLVIFSNVLDSCFKAYRCFLFQKIFGRNQFYGIKHPSQMS